MKKFPDFCLLLVLLYVDIDGTSAIASKNYIQDARECLSGISPSACSKRLFWLPLQRPGRRLEPTFARALRVFGLVKQPRVGRSDPALSSNDWDRETEEDSSTDGHRDYERLPGSSANHRPESGEREESLRNLEYYLATQRRNSIAPWALFLITPNFQNVDQLQAADNLSPQLGHEADDIKQE